MLDTRCLIICPSNQVAISFTFPKILGIAASSFHPSVGSRHELARRTSRKSLGPHTLNCKLITQKKITTHPSHMQANKNWTMWSMCCCSKVPSQKIVELEENNKKASARAQCSRWIVLSWFFTKKSPKSYYGRGVITAALSRHLQHFLTRQAANGGGQMIHLSNLWMLRMPLSCAEDPGNMIYCLRLTFEFVTACRYQL